MTDHQFRVTVEDLTEGTRQVMEFAPGDYLLSDRGGDWTAPDQGEVRGWQQAVEALRGVEQRTASPAARWAADYLEAVGPGGETAGVQVDKATLTTTMRTGVDEATWRRETLGEWPVDEAPR